MFRPLGSLSLRALSLRFTGVLLGPLLGLLAFGLCAAPANADIIVTYNNSSPSVMMGMTSFNYKFTFTSTIADDTLDAGDTITFYDVGPVTAGGLGNDFSFFQNTIGITPPAVSSQITDSPTILNATFTYIGSFTSTNMRTFNVSLISGFATTRSGQFASKDGNVNVSVSRFGAVAVPNFSNINGPGPTAGVPEPSQTAVLGVGLLGLAGLLLTAKKRKASASAIA